MFSLHVHQTVLGEGRRICLSAPVIMFSGADTWKAGRWSLLMGTTDLQRTDRIEGLENGDY